MSLAPHIHAMGRGPSRARSLTEAEAEEAMTMILAGRAEPEGIGALLMLMRYRGETAEEVAGFARAARADTAGWRGIGADLDWPSYAAGRTRGLPWFLLAARLVAQAGHPVLLHGWNSHHNPVADVRAAVRAMSIPVTGCADSARTALSRGGIAYVPLEALSPQLLSLLRLRDVLGLRSVVNTVCRMLNPAAAEATVQGVFHPSYRELQQDAAALLGQRNLMVLKGGGGEFERNPAKQVELYGLASGEAFRHRALPRVEAHRRLSDLSTAHAHLTAVWRGTSRDPWAEETIIGTTGAALAALDPAQSLDEAERHAARLWQSRTGQIAA